MKRRPVQQSFQGFGLKKPMDEFGGSLLKGNAKTKRPLDSKLPIHLVLRARKSSMRLPKTFSKVNEIVRQTAAKHGVRIYEYANVGNHLHIVIRIAGVRFWAAFIRELSGRIAQEVMELVPFGEQESFWRFKPFTRIVRGWKKAYQAVKEYVQLNQLEAEGHISRKETKSLRELKAMWADTA